VTGLIQHSLLKLGSLPDLSAVLEVPVFDAPAPRQSSRLAWLGYLNCSTFINIANTDCGFCLSYDRKVLTKCPTSAQDISESFARMCQQHKQAQLSSMMA